MREWWRRFEEAPERIKEIYKSNEGSDSSTTRKDVLSDKEPLGKRRGGVNPRI
jgi:hypothetical protein